MVEKYVMQPSALARLQRNVFGPYLPSLVQSLEQAEYAAETIRLHLRAVIRFGTWLQRQTITLGEINEATVNRYVRYEQQKTSSRSGPYPYKAIGLRHLLCVLRQHGAIAVPTDTGPHSSVEEWLRSFADYLEHVTGCASKCQKNYLRTARRLFQELFSNGEVQWEKLTAVVLTQFVRREAAKLQPSAYGQPVTATRLDSVSGVSGRSVRRIARRCARRPDQAACYHSPCDSCC